MKESDAKQLTEIFNGIADGETLSNMCKEKGMSFGKFYRRLDADTKLSDRYVAAKNICMSKYEDEILEISNEDPQATKSLTGGLAASDQKRVRIDTRKWIMAHIRPTKYGDRVALDHGGQAGNPVIKEIQRTVVDKIIEDKKDEDNKDGDEPSFL